MVRINKVYTKKGDGGKTSLSSGERVSKDHPRVEAFGCVDELNSALGLVRSFNRLKPASEKLYKFDLILQSIQQRLFDMGSLLSNSGHGRGTPPPPFPVTAVEWLEQVIDAMNQELPPLESFILPGGSPVNGLLHQSRTVCRRAEREILRLSNNESIDAMILPYINRLSDALFVFSRWVAAHLDEEEFLWQPGATEPENWQWKDEP